MDQQAANVTVSSLADTEKDILSASAVLRGNQSNRRCDVPPTGVAFAIANYTVKCTGQYGTISWNLLQPLACIVLTALDFQFMAENSTWPSNSVSWS